jgi:predicted dehydrogenase
MVERQWRVGIIGCGRIAGGHARPEDSSALDTHAAAYHRHPAFQMVAACDADASALERFQRSWRVTNGYNSPTEMCRRHDLDVVSVCSPDAMHYQNAMDVIESGNPPAVLLVEKPVCVLPEQLVRMAGAANEARVAVAVNHTRRFDPAHARLADTIRSGLLGELEEGSWTYYGGWLHNGVHAVDTLAMLLGEQPFPVSARVVRSSHQNDADLRVVTEVGDATVVFEAFDQSLYQLFQAELRFRLGLVRLSDFGKIIEIETVGVNSIGERVLERLPNSPITGLSRPMYNAVCAIDERQNGRLSFTDIGVDLRSAAGTMRTVWEAYELALPKEVTNSA